MTTFKQKFTYTLKNAEKYLDALRHTQRQRIQEVSDGEESETHPKDNTFQEQQYPQVILEISKVKTVADRLEFDFLKKTYIEYCRDLDKLDENQQNLLLSIQKVVEKLNYIKESPEIISKLIRNNHLLDEQISKYEEEERQIDLQLIKENFAEMKLLESTKKNIRNLLKLTNDENEIYMGFTKKWNSYIEQSYNRVPIDQKQFEFISKNIEEENKKNNNIADEEELSSQKLEKVQKSLIPNDKRKKRESDLLMGNLKEFSKNLKIPEKKKTTTLI